MKKLNSLQMASSMEPSSSGMIEGRGGEDDNDNDTDSDDGCSSLREILVVVLVDVVLVLVLVDVLDVIVFAREW